MDFEVVVEPLDEVYEMYVNWCVQRKFPYRKQSELGNAFVCYNGSIPVYICFLWTTNSTFAVLGFPISNPHVGYEYKSGGMSFLFDKMTKKAKELGATMIWTTSDTHNVEEALKKANFNIADQQVNQYYKVLF